MANQDWYYAENGQQRGPVDLNTLRQLASTGSLKGNDLVWCDGMPSWSPAHVVPDLASAFAPAAPTYPQAPQPYGSAPPPYAVPAPAFAPPAYGAPMQH